MSTRLTVDAVRTILESGAFEKLVGVVEDEVFEAKSAPYQLKSEAKGNGEHGKMELAKDVSAFANAAGGVILIGVRTEKNPSHLGDEVSEISPLRQSLVDIDAYCQVLREWVYPRLPDVDIRWYPSQSDASIGVVGIIVPLQPESRKPFLLTRTLKSPGRVTTILLGNCERHRANAAPMSVQDLHALLRDGRLAGREREEMASVLAILEELRQRQRVEDSEARLARLRETITDRVAAARSAADLDRRSVIELTAFPAQHVDVQGLFMASTPASDVVERPHRLRQMGFNLADDRPESSIVLGKIRRRTTKGMDLLEYWRDGMLIFVAPADEGFLGWASLGGDSLNPLVLVEVIYLFVATMAQALDTMAPRPTAVQYRVSLKFVGGHRPFLPQSYVIPRVPAHRHGRAPEAEGVIEVDQAANEDVGVVAFELVSRVYNWFGLPADAVYCANSTQGGGWVIDPQRLVSAGSR